MWRKQREKYRLVLTVEEGKPTEDIEELIIKLS